MSKQPFAVIDARDKTVTLEADYWEGPTEAGRAGRYVRRRFVEQWIDRKEYDVTGARRVRPGRPLNASPNVSYYSRLLAAFAKIGCRP